MGFTLDSKLKLKDPHKQRICQVSLYVLHLLQRLKPTYAYQAVRFDRLFWVVPQPHPYHHWRSGAMLLAVEWHFSLKNKAVRVISCSGYM